MSESTNVELDDKTLMNYYATLDNVDISFVKFKEIINSNYNLIDTLLDGKKLDNSNIPFIIAKLMVQFENILILSGKDKKKVLMVLLKIYLDNMSKESEVEENNTNQSNLEIILNTLVSGMIDTMISIDKKDITINKVAKTCCFSFMKVLVENNKV